MTEADLASHLQGLELALLHERWRREELEALLHEEFEEVGPQGRVSTRAQVLHWLLEVKNPADRWDLHDFRLSVPAPDIALARYHARRRGSASAGSLRASLWRRGPEGNWRLFFHQATPLAGPA